MSEKTTYRTPRDKPYFSLNRATAQDENLSFEARGLLAYLLSKPDDWKVILSDVQHNGNIGRDKARRLLKELEDAGYIKREDQIVNPDGTFGNIPYRIYETKQQPCTENPSTVNPSTENPTLHNTETTENRVTEKTLASPDGNAQSVLETDAALYGETVIEAEALMPVEKPKKERPPNLWYDAIAATLGVEGWKNGHIQNVLLGTGKNGYSRYNLHTPLTEPEQVHIFWAWFEKKCKGCELKSVATTQSRVMEWQREGMPDVRNEVKPKSQTDIAMERLAQGLPYVFG